MRAAGKQARLPPHPRIADFCGIFRVIKTQPAESVESPHPVQQSIGYEPGHDQQRRAVRVPLLHAPHIDQPQQGAHTPSVCRCRLVRQVLLGFRAAHGEQLLHRAYCRWLIALVSSQQDVNSAAHAVGVAHRNDRAVTLWTGTQLVAQTLDTAAPVQAASLLRLYCIDSTVPKKVHT